MEARPHPSYWFALSAPYGIYGASTLHADSTYQARSFPAHLVGLVYTISFGARHRNCSSKADINTTTHPCMDPWHTADTHNHNKNIRYIMKYDNNHTTKVKESIASYLIWLLRLSHTHRHVSPWTLQSTVITVMMTHGNTRFITIWSLKQEDRKA